ncbi:MAG: translation elongation factor Ts [Chloroflexota bacterium]
MAEITAQMVKDLREATGAGPLDCKKALEQNDGDIDKAIEWLREKGLSKAAKKLGAGRTMNEGRIETYAHFNNRLAVMVEVNCETDFVAATDAFQSFAKDVALHIANMAPAYLTREAVPAEVIEAERKMQMRILKEDPKNTSKPDDILEKIIEGRMTKWFEEIVLMEQPFIKDDSKTIADLLAETVAEIGESVQVARFARFALGEHSGDEGEA